MSVKTSLSFSLLTAAAAAFPHNYIQPQQDNTPSILPYSLPDDDDQLLRATGITTKQATFLYGPGIGGGPSSPAGPLGVTYVTRDSVISDGELALQIPITTGDATSARLNSAKYNGLETLDDYTKLYDNEWEKSSYPTGIDPGLLTNYTQDLLFSMERLSLNPYAVRRLQPSESLPFTLHDDLTHNITGQTLTGLLSSNRLFYVDHRAQGKLERAVDGKYSAACDAFFYISESSSEFLPLAIRTNTDNDLVYTPQDSENDWLLAKIMFNTNDFFMGQFHHLANTHYVTEVAHQAAVRTLSDDHPVLAIMSRLLYGAFGIRALALTILFRPGGSVDQYFGYTGSAAAQFSNDTYNNGYAGAVQSNYFRRNLQKRGLIDASPALPSFPFYDDASAIHSAIRTFMGEFVASYYADEAAIRADHELQAWLVEANGPAQSIDFPTSDTLHTPSDLADLLTHMAHLVSSAHHSVNLNQLITGSAVLPFHPTAQYQPIPTAKGIPDVVPYLPPLDKCIGFLSVSANFARPSIADTSRTIVHMFDDPVMLVRMTPATRDANEEFVRAMSARSAVVRARSFDGDGLSQGMPFVWKALDPGTAPWSLTI